MNTKKFIKLSKVDMLQDSELNAIKGGKLSAPLYGIPPWPLYGIEPLYGISPWPLYGVEPLYGISPIGNIIS